MGLALPKQIGKPPADHAVIFIHGLGGSISTWKQFSKVVKSSWTGADCYDLLYEEYTVELNWLARLPYLNTIIRMAAGGPKLNYLSHHVRNTIDELCLEHRYVILVGHSMGGIIAREYILEKVRHSKDTGKVKALFTYATPHKGSKYASLYKKIMKPLRYLGRKSTIQIDEMCKENSNLLDKMNRDWSKLRVNQHVDFIRIVGGRDKVVDVESAAAENHLNDPKIKLIATKDHSSIIRPKNSSDKAFLPFYNYLVKFRRKIELEDEANEIWDDEEI